MADTQVHCVSAYNTDAHFPNCADKQTTCVSAFCTLSRTSLHHTDMFCSGGLFQIVRTLDPIAQLPFLRIESHEDKDHQLTDWTGYLVFYLTKSTWLRFKNRQQVEDTVRFM